MGKLCVIRDYMHRKKAMVVGGIIGTLWGNTICFLFNAMFIGLFVAFIVFLGWSIISLIIAIVILEHINE